MVPFAEVDRNPFSFAGKFVKFASHAHGQCAMTGF